LFLTLPLIVVICAKQENDKIFDIRNDAKYLNLIRIKNRFSD
jgi:hypothetical protein